MKKLPLLFCLVFLVPVFFDNNLIDVNIFHNFIFSLFFLLSVISVFTVSLKSGKAQLNNVLLLLSLLFFVFIFLSSIINDSFIVSLNKTVRFLCFFMFSYFLVIVSNIMELNDFLKYISFTIIVASVIISALGFIQLLGIEFLYISRNRPGSTLGIRNFAAEYISTAVIFSIFYYFFSKHKKTVILCLISLLISYTYLLILRTRASFVSFVVTMMIFLILMITFYRKKSFSHFVLPLKTTIFIKLFLLLFFLLISFFFVNYFSLSSDPERNNLIFVVKSIFNDAYSPNQARLLFWNTSLEIFKGYPFFGVGTDNWFSYFPFYNGNMFTDENIKYVPGLNPHNEYLQILNENGIFGFTAFFSISVISVMLLIKKSFKQVNYLPFLLVLINILILFFFSFPLDNISVLILFFTAVGFSFAGFPVHVLSKKKISSIFRKILSYNVKFNFKVTLSVLLLLVTAVLFFNFTRYRYEKIYTEAMKFKFSSDYSSMISRLENINNLIYPVDPNKTPLSYYNGTGYYVKGNYDTALLNYQNALKIAPYNPSILNNEAAALYKTGNTSKAVEKYNFIMGKFPYFIEPQINLLSIYTNTKKDSLALQIIGNINNKIKNGMINPSAISNYNIFNLIKEFYKGI
ncbi:MAG: tetratricopeptide repeat protein [Ignavibacteria bacterium]|nr:tetratricopeptide repeat protein [Ignavibacteria bacterium]